MPSDRITLRAPNHSLKLFNGQGRKNVEIKLKMTQIHETSSHRHP